MKKAVEKYVTEFAICQRSKAELYSYPGLLEPLDTPDLARQHITMDFLEGLPKSLGKKLFLW
jgi:hypothetical protein